MSNKIDFIPKTMPLNNQNIDVIENDYEPEYFPLYALLKDPELIKDIFADNSIQYNLDTTNNFRRMLRLSNKYQYAYFTTIVSNKKYTFYWPLNGIDIFLHLTTTELANLMSIDDSLKTKIMAKLLGANE